MGHLKLIYPLKMVIFHSYVSLPEVSSTNFHFHWILNVFFLFFSTISSGARFTTHAALLRGNLRLLAAPIETLLLEIFQDLANSDS